MILSRPVMTTLSRLAMVYSVVEQMRNSPIYETHWDQVEWVNVYRRNLKVALLNHNGIPYHSREEGKHCDGILPVLGRHNGRLHRFETRFMAFVRDGLPAELDAQLWLSAVLVQCEIQHNEIPERNEAARAGWMEIIVLLGEIAEAFSPGLITTEDMLAGESFGRELMRATQ